ncbi:branched-chain amino acid aminotransferase [Streptomyces sp. NPDC048385]|uniref:branched-chain amino acid aminotransferase n=1 Tax=unclassified Streptomyces TaxID=2593676 RepID=UPI003414D419
MTTLEIGLKPSLAPLPRAAREDILANPGFGRHFTDHMVTIKWTRERSWHDAQLAPYAPLSLDPANKTLHYGQAIFEGLKVYRQPDGTSAAFRPIANAERFRRSAQRMAMPELPSEFFLASCQALVRQDRDWVPESYDASLYLRPFMFATERGFGVHPADEFLFVVIASPAGAYFSGGVRPVSVWLSEDYVRAVIGGTGAAKTSGNYAASLIAQAEATEQGCDQVVWLDAFEHRWVEEMGGMNLYFVYGDRIVTPALTGTVLPGITRDSLLTIARDLGLTAEEGRISVEDWRRDAENGTLTEVFACGTGAVVTPVGQVKSRHSDWSQGDGKPGEVTMRLRKSLVDLQTGRSPDPYGWMHPLA